MHRRFEDAPTLELDCAEGSVEVAVADRFRMRLLGLMHLGAEEIEPLLFPRCHSIHTIGMRVPIDLVWLELDDNRARVAGVVEALEPNRHARAPRAGAGRRSISALELSTGEARRLGLRPGACAGVR
jgi:uncharacterized protein